MPQRYPPGPETRLPILNLRNLQQNRLEFLTHNREEYGDIVHFRLGPRHIYQINHPDYIQEILVKHPEQFQKTQMLKQNTQRIIGNGLLTNDGESHKRQRRLVQPAFHHNRIAAYADVMVEYTQDMLGRWQPGDQHDIAHDMMELTMRIIAKTLFNTDVSNQSDALGQAVTIGIETATQRITTLLKVPDWIPTATNRKRQQAAQTLESTIMKIINERRSSGDDTGDLLSMLLLAVDEEDGGGMTNKQVRDEAMTLFIAGHETTANALAWTFYLLAQHPEIEEKLIHELTTKLNGRPPQVTDLPNLSYTEMVIKESMRLYPPAWTVTRQTIEAVEIGGYLIPAGSVLLISQYIMHRHPDYWELPEQFNPERFAPELEKRIPRYAYFPFGGGPRICIGNQFALMEANLVLATIAQRYHLALLPGQTVMPEPLITLRPQHGIQMEIHERTGQQHPTVPEPATA
ncbi:MAG: cytochrome P450 [Anaerolineaceae bacterium]|nr:cytochrome P450 [Anaerolineaceae bacterium]